MEAVSGVLWSCANEATHDKPLGIDFVFLPNPNARVPVPLEFLAWMEIHRRADDRLIREPPIDDERVGESG
jgi:hypothetical protein